MGWDGVGCISEMLGKRMALACGQRMILPAFCLPVQAAPHQLKPAALAHLLPAGRRDAGAARSHRSQQLVRQLPLDLVSERKVGDSIFGLAVCISLGPPLQHRDGLLCKSGSRAQAAADEDLPGWLRRPAFRGQGARTLQAGERQALA